MPDSGYGVWARALHRLTLGAGFVAEASFDLDRALFKPRATGQGRHVFVSGLARAGTTILMRALHGTGAFRSLTYRDMPLVLAPNLWARLSGTARRDMAAAERAHGDGIAVDFDSPEALEEVFWRIFCADAYMHPDRLVPMRADAETLDRFRAYVGQILRSGGADRYLSKNNNSILRLPSLAKAFPDAAILIPFRDPVQQATSLLRQHRMFRDRHAKDPFARRYMDWLAHHEFGAGQRPFVFDGTVPPGDPDDLSYWLHLWRSSYAHVLETAPQNAVFVCYEHLCAGQTWPRLSQLLDLPAQDAQPSFVQPKTTPLADTLPDGDITSSCTLLYRRLVKTAL